MRVIRTCKYRMIRRATCWLTVLILFMASVAVFAKPPPVLVQYLLKNTELVHNGTCNVKQMGLTGTRCLIFHEAKHGITWLVLFDHELKETHVLADKNDVLVTVWCRHDVCT